MYRTESTEGLSAEIMAAKGICHIFLLYVGNSISKLQIQVATYVF